MRLPRPHISLETKAYVLLRQLGALWPDDEVRVWKERRQLAGEVRARKNELAELLGCKPTDLQLDHDPALENRLLIGGKYFPDANHPAYLMYRTRHDHHIKTNVRGDGAQYCDRVLAKRERRRKKKKIKRKWPSRPFPKRVKT